MRSPGSRNSGTGLEVLPNHNLWEANYIKAIFNHLYDSVKNNYRFVITDHLTLFTDPDNRTVVFYLSNEDGRLPSYTSKVAALFTPYPPVEAKPNVYTIPLGPGSWPDKIQAGPVLDRGIDVFFSGRKLQRRKSAFDALDQLNKDQSIQLKLKKTNAFGDGLAAGQYFKGLADAKIAIAPEGLYSNITFRHFEALLAGCVVISAHLPDVPFYEDFPGIQVEDWQNLPGLIRDMLKNPEYLEHLQAKGIKYYYQGWAPKVVAGFIQKKLETKATQAHAL